MKDKENEFGMPLDKNGYSQSIIPGHSVWCCWNCKQNGAVSGGLDRHEVIHNDMGGKYRERCKRFGLWVHLCHNTCHQGDRGVHANYELDLRLKQEAQRSAMQEYGWSVEEFQSLFGKNYLEDTNG